MEEEKEEILDNEVMFLPPRPQFRNLQSPVEARRSFRYSSFELVESKNKERIDGDEVEAGRQEACQLCAFLPRTRTHSHLL